MNKNKNELLKLIVANLTARLEVLENAARASQRATADENGQAENPGDNHGVEGLHFAGGQARQARAIAEAIEYYESMIAKNFAPHEPIDLSAVVELDTDGSRIAYFIGPRSGGMQLQYRRKEIMVITPQSLIGRSLLGRKKGERWKARVGASVINCHIVSVS